MGPLLPETDTWTFDRRLLVRLDVFDDVVDVLRIVQAVVWHPVALHLGLRIGDVLAQRGFVPNKIRPLHRIGIAKIFKRARPAPEHALEAWPQRIRLLLMARRTGDKQRLAVL